MLLGTVTAAATRFYCSACYVFCLTLMTGKGATTFFFKPELRFKVCCKVDTKSATSAKMKQMQEILADLHRDMLTPPISSDSQ